VLPQTSPSPESISYDFSPRELERLTIYRAAIAAEFYTDRCEPERFTRESIWRLPDLSTAA